MTKEEVLEEIKASMKARTKERTAILRQVHQAVKQIEIDQQREVTEADVTAVVKKLIKVTSEELDALRKAPGDHASRESMLADNLTVLQELLPAQLEGAELEKLADEVIAHLGATTKRDMGRVMGELTKRTDGNLDKAFAAKYVGSKLS